MEQINTKLQVYDLEGKAAGTIQLDKELFDGNVNMTLLYEVKKMYEANARQGNASTKTRGEVSGGGKKPWKQKGTGRARFGSSRNPIWRHGGVAFGPRPRDYSYSMPKKAMKKALVSGLNARLLENMIKPVVKIELKETKTKAFLALLNNLSIEGKALVVVDAVSAEVALSARNIKSVSLREGRNINARDILLNDSIIIEKEAFEKLSERLK